MMDSLCLIHHTAFEIRILNTMKTKSLKKLAWMLSRNEGISLIPIIAIMVIMSVMGGVFTSIMGNWKMSAASTLYSNKAFFLAETAAMTAIQDAQYRFYSKKDDGSNRFNFGISTANPYPVSIVTTGNFIEKADYWFEMPGVTDDGFSDPNDDNVNDDGDDIGTGSPEPNRYTIIATGRVDMVSSTLAKRQIKILADITPFPADTIPPGVQTNGDIKGMVTATGTNGFGVFFPSTGTVIYDLGVNNIYSGSEVGIVIHSAPTLETFDKGFVKALATDQSNDHSGSYTVTIADYPKASFYYDSVNTMPNFIYVEGNLTVNTNCNVNGVIWVTGDVILNDTATMNAIIICEGAKIHFDDISNLSNMQGGIIHYNSTGEIIGNDNLNAIVVDQTYFNILNATVPTIDVISWQEAVSAM